MSTTSYVRFHMDEDASYGVLRDQRVHRVEGDLFGEHTVSEQSHALSDVKLLYPCEPGKVMAVGLNYKSHIGSATPPSRPEIFYKAVTALQNPEDPIVIPAGATDLHYEGELVLVIGKVLKDVSPEEASAGIFGVTCGNDISERQWQLGPDHDLQWWRAKGCDTFAPLGPAIVTGLDYGNLLLQTILNGKIVQKQVTSDLIFDGPTIVSWISRHVTLEPGDIIYTGTPGSTAALKSGDVVEVDIQGIGVLRNPVQ